MLAVKAYYDGKNLKLFEKLPKNKKYKVLITFIEEVENEDELRAFSSQTSSFKFWEDAREDLYQDYLPAEKKK